MTDTTDSGFQIYAERTRSKDEWLYGRPATVKVVESSIARGPHVFIFEGAENSIHLNLTEAKMVQEALGRFIAEVPDRWEQDV